MRISGVFRAALLAAAAMSAFSLPASTEANTVAISSERNVAAFDASMINPAHETRVLAAATVDDDDDDDVTTKAPKKTKKKKKSSSTDAPSTKAPSAAEKEAKEEAESTQAPKKKKKKSATRAPVTADEEESTPTTKAHATKKKSTKATTTEDVAEIPEPVIDSSVSEKKIKGNKNEGIIDGSSEGSAEIDKIDLRNEDGWVSVYNDPPLIVIKASLYAFISYNDTEVCDTFNMTMNAVEQKAEENGRFSYHVVAYINCTKDGEDETQGRFILNFIPEGKRLLLTECGHREEGEIVNWLRIQEEVPECMTPTQRKKFLAQPMKHIHATNGTSTDVEATKTDFLSRLEDFDPEEVAIAGTATVALIAVVVVLVVFVMRKRKAQRDLERTIAGAKAEHAVEDDNLQTETEEKTTKERKGLMDSSKAKSDDPDMEEGSFVNSPAVRV
ncbi:hypothetical protein PF005_g5051 [Phytophthora fragariae]|uniref:Uncharacterized protein n=1 Tax=Phytophthora fragariae TaxID=53985 RepID=A0A6A3YYL7_9STRA|nr:hypothetical protein PF003_g35371 [Phytophthora fragariae]KAE8945287.1 hypothetical protein PF009_g5060 [Phytophthora fragariae]KAE9022164.1 hypothetical protein PF011_g4596 [Phytophthora fragariae]KAE9127608.1 hypothetical protein PF010_g4816 [Phytophthora fragariae]KAE9129029.1 hypothetical protein PF007_g5063 [Phytophthora fragariae]